MHDTCHELEHFTSIDAKLVDLAKEVRILSKLSWPNSVQQRFLDGWRRGAVRLPEVTYPRVSLADRIEPLRALKRNLDREHPVGRYLGDSIQSYITVCRLLENAGSPRMTAFSTELYGRPGDSLAGGRVHNIDAARHFLEIAAQYNNENMLSEGDYCLPAARIQAEMSERLGQVFTGHAIKVVVDPDMVSKAAAGATRIRLRDATCFSEFDLEQLLQHEAFVHSLTAINGRSQGHLKSMGLGAPRTTATQEGLATFAELVTGAIDISRLERIALRIIAIDMALDGGDFLDVFRFLVESGQTENESFNSAMRVFRGAPLTGGVGVHQGRGVPARPHGGAHVLPLVPAARQAGALPDAVRRPPHHRRRHPPGRLVPLGFHFRRLVPAALDGTRQRPGGLPGVLGVRQPHPDQGAALGLLLRFGLRNRHLKPAHVVTRPGDRNQPKFWFAKSQLTRLFRKVSRNFGRAFR